LGVTAAGELTRISGASRGGHGTMPCVTDRWRRPSRPGCLALAAFWFVYLVVGVLVRRWTFVAIGCLQLGLAGSLAWDLRWTRWTPNWWPRGRKGNRTQ
jgi:hypothetical protein